MKSGQITPKEDGVKVRGIPLRWLNIAMLVLALVLSSLLIYSTSQTTRSYNALLNDTEDYIECEQATSNMQMGSDYLKAQARSFVITGNHRYADNFFTEVEVTKRRDQALTTFKIHLNDTDTYELLSEALDRSNELMHEESYAMRLVIEAEGSDVTSYATMLQEVELSAEDMALSAEEKRELAIKMVFGDDYQAKKDKVDATIRQCSEELIQQTRNKQQNSSAELLKLLRRQQILQVIFLLTVAIVFLLVAFLVVQPLRQVISYLQNHLPLPVKGSYEVQYMASIYNSMYDRNKEDQDRLAYDATHDALTGLLNRGAFEKERDANKRRIAMILVDVDYFKQVNDTYGHDKGDQALQKVASLLRSTFREEDHAFRIGGDEFVVIMTYADSSMIGLVRNKFRQISAALADTSDGVPALTLSVGVAFSDRPNPTDDIYKDADSALYKVKERGRNGIEFYE